MVVFTPKGPPSLKQLSWHKLSFLPALNPSHTLLTGDKSQKQSSPREPLASCGTSAWVILFHDVHNIYYHPLNSLQLFFILVWIPHLDTVHVTRSAMWAQINVLQLPDDGETKPKQTVMKTRGILHKLWCDTENMAMLHWWWAYQIVKVYLFYTTQNTLRGTRNTYYL